jgi:GntR family transcriptional regulator
VLPPASLIDRALPVPFYFQLAQLLEDEIVTGRWEPGTRVPSEAELGSSYGLSRTTIRQALARLEQEGLVRRQKGHGTFVSHSRPRSWPLDLSAGLFQDELLQVSSRILRLERVSLPQWASAALELPNGAEGVVVERLRSVDGLVALYVINYLPEFAADIVLGLDPSESLYQRLAERGDIIVVGGQRSISAVRAGTELAALLEVDAASALAYIESVSRDSGGNPVDCHRAWLNTERMRINIQVGAESDGEVASTDVLETAPAEA